MINIKKEKQFTIYDIRHSCNCDSGSVNTNKFIDDDEPLMCEKCDGYITAAQLPEGMMFMEQLGTH